MVAATIDNIAPILGPGTACINYIDVLQVWLRDDLPEKHWRFLNAHSGSLWRGRHLGIKEPLCWAPQWRHTVRLYQPHREAIQFLAEIDQVLITYLELAHDQIMTSPEAVEAWLRLAREHFVQRWHGKRRTRIWANGNWRSGDLDREILRDGKKIRQRKIGTVFQGYGDRPCKVTGEIDCGHLEAKVYGSSAIRRIGISHPQDLIGFDVEGFWRNNLILLDVDRERLGRWYTNRIDRTRLQKSPITNSGYNPHRSTGNLLCRIYGMDPYGGFSIQTLIDQLGRGPWIERLSGRSSITAKTGLRMEELVDRSKGSATTSFLYDDISRDGLPNTAMELDR